MTRAKAVGARAVGVRRTLVGADTGDDVAGRRTVPEATVSLSLFASGVSSLTSIESVPVA